MAENQKIHSIIVMTPASTILTIFLVNMANTHPQTTPGDNRKSEGTNIRGR
ncbi:hypothetical protein J7W08_02320 [Methanococcoides orientis]|uniref:hypothetical protein n=1 Tax=Methanococcoides orientis TaxID=2822137 RepID=UPI001E61DAA4|nr:hypothetical protein [Methanococcoides orientis]UGV41165.1 hypothetical protein J7W08_02320 [Methanococcoides orientis]